jgi:hypothetical protein
MAWKLLRPAHATTTRRPSCGWRPIMGYLPVRIRLTQANGDFADLRLRSSGPP